MPGNRCKFEWRKIPPKSMFVSRLVTCAGPNKVPMRDYGKKPINEQVDPKPWPWSDEPPGGGRSRLIRTRAPLAFQACRRLPFVRRTFYPDYGTGFPCNAALGERRRNCDHDGRCLLRLLVQTAGLQIRHRRPVMKPRAAATGGGYGQHPRSKPLE